MSTTNHLSELLGPQRLPVLDDHTVSSPARSVSTPVSVSVRTSALPEPAVPAAHTTRAPDSTRLPLSVTRRVGAVGTLAGAGVRHRLVPSARRTTSRPVDSMRANAFAFGEA